MKRLLPILLLAGCGSNPLIISPKEIPDNGSYLGCADTSSSLNGTRFAGTMKGFRCTKVGGGFDNVKRITTPAGTVEFENAE